MNRITSAVLSFLELAEAEGRELRSQAEFFARRVLMQFIGGLMLFAAAVAVGFAFYVALAPKFGRPAAALAVSFLLALPGAYIISKSASGRATAARETLDQDGGENNDAR